MGERHILSEEDAAGCACKMVLTRGEWMDGPGSLADSLAESAQVGHR